MGTTKTDILKKNMKEALVDSLGVVYSAAVMVRKKLINKAKSEDAKKAIPLAESIRKRHYEWIESDAEYKALVNEIKEIAIDFGETQLHKRMKEGSDTAIIFYLKTQGKKRGYVERTETEVSGKLEMPKYTWGEDNEE